LVDEIILNTKFYENQYYSCEDAIYGDRRHINIPTMELFCENEALYLVQISKVMGIGHHDSRTTDLASGTAEMSISGLNLQCGYGERRCCLPYLRVRCHHWIGHSFPGTPSAFQVSRTQSFSELGQ